MSDIPTFAKWAGGKKQLIRQFEQFFPKQITNYHEPFVGGGSIAFHVLKKYKTNKVHLSDTNEELVNCYNVIKDNVKELIWSLKQYAKRHDKIFYYQIRDKDVSKLSRIQRAARFIYLNKTCFNGLYRVNKAGGFNVPIGSYKNPSIVQEKDLQEISKLLKKNVTVKKSSFENVLNRAKKGDFIYFDPPYYPVQKNSFTTYTKDNFLDEEQKKLAHIFKKLDQRGCYIMLSNSDTDFIKKLYQDYNISIVKARRMINCDATKRGAINELVVTNYPLNQASLKS